MNHIPIRTCISCRCKRSKSDLLRIVKFKKNVETLTTVKIDENQRMMGRGLYLCYNLDCLEKFRKIKNKKKRNLINLDEHLLLEIERTIKTFEEQNTGLTGAL